MKKIGDENIWIPQRADPYVYRHMDGSYYFTASLPEYNGIAIRRADTLCKLAAAPEILIWRKHVRGPMGAHIWAPELHYLDGKWYLYFAAGDAERIWHIRPYVLECSGQDPLKDDWIERGMLQAADHDEFSFQGFSLDATVFENKEKRYCIWAEKVGAGSRISNLYIAQMETPLKLKTQQVLLSTPDYEWERRGFWVNEGAAVLHHGGKIFVTYSASDTGPNYCMGMLSIPESEDLLDPQNWKKERVPVLQTDESRSLYGPGHNSFTVDEEGNTILVCHCRTTAQIEGNPLYNPNRHAMLGSVKWNEQGEPEFEIE